MRNGASLTDRYRRAVKTSVYCLSTRCLAVVFVFVVTSAPTVIVVVIMVTVMAIMVMMFMLIMFIASDCVEMLASEIGALNSVYLVLALPVFT